jgi:hypothetical protein
MSHETSGTILHSILDPFDPTNEHYEGVREHFSTAELTQIDAIRAYPDDHHFTLAERLFISYMLGKVVMTASNPED